MGADLQCRARFAYAACADNRHQPVRRNEVRNLRHLFIAPDERTDLLRQIVGQRAHRSKRRKLAPQAVSNELVDAFGLRKILKPVRPQIEHFRHCIRVPQEIARRTGKQYLAAMRYRQQSSRSIYRDAEKVSIPLFASTGVNCGANEQSVDGAEVFGA